MVNQNTLDIINYSKDLDFEFNMKLAVLGLLLIYSIWVIYSTKDYKFTTISNAILVAYSKIISYVYLFNLPLILSFFLYRGTWESLTMFLLGFYSITYIVLFAFGQFWSIEFVVKLFAKILGVDIKSPEFTDFLNNKIKKK